MKPIRLLTALAAIGIAHIAWASPLNILQIRDSLHTTPAPICLPESFETDVHAMQQNWYLRQYADIDRDADHKASVIPIDDELIERLGSMPTEIEMPLNSLVKNHIMAYVDRRKQLVENMLGMSLYYMPIFEQALDRNGMPLELKYLPVIESALNPDAVSRVGATGLWQFMLDTATGEGLEVNSLVDQRRDPYTSSEAAAKYLKKLYGIFGDWSLAIAAYNCGPGNVTKAIRRAGDGKKDFWEIYPYLPAETRGYVPAFIAANYAMNFYDKHNISPALAKKPIVTDTVHISRRVHFQQISDVLSIPLDELRTLNPQYRKDIIPGDIHPYALVLPSLQVYAYLANEDSIVNHNAEKYARRDRVEPAQAGAGSDANGEFVEELVVKYHTVKRGETISSIANKYGVTASSIRKTNKLGKSVKRGQKLKINTYRRKYITPKAAPAVTEPDTTAVIADSTAVVPVLVEPDSVQQATAPSQENKKVSEAFSKSAKAKQAPAPQKKQPQPAKAKTYTVKAGDNLSKIARANHTTVDALRRANNIKGDAIRQGQKLKIPAK